MTARHALADLAREGLVDRKHGAGTFVAAPKIQFNKLMSYTDQMASRGLSARSKVVRLSSGEHHPEIAARLLLPSNSPLTVIQRIRQGGDEPFALETYYLPADKFVGLARPALERGSLFATLEGEYGVALAYSDEEVDATDADQGVADLLSIPRGAPMLRIRQVIYSTAGIPALYVVGLYRSGKHTLLIRRFR
jgi:GntR family transcriptional regulator